MRALLFVFIASTLCTCTQAPSVLEQIRSQGQLRFITRNSPTTWYLGPGEPRGIEYELASGFASRLGVSLELISAEHAWQIVPGVIAGDAHIAATGLAVDAALADTDIALGPNYEFSLPQVVYRRGTRRPKGIEDLIGARIAVIADSDYATSLRTLRETQPELQWSEHSDASVEDLVRRVTDGDFDYTIVDSNLFAILRQYHPEARAAFSLSEARPIAWALPGNAPELREAVSAWFAEISATGELQKITQKYAAAAQHFDYVGSRAFVRHSKSRLPQFRDQFKSTGRTSGFDWRLLAAIAYQESHWRADAVSPTGVRGLMMLTEHAAQAVAISDREDPTQSIQGGAEYLLQMIDKLPDRIPENDRLWLALAAYNIGFGHLEDARIITQMNGGDADSWDDVSQYLPLLTDEKWHSRVRRGYARGDVPVQYVENIRRYYQLMQWLDDSQPRSNEIFAINRSDTRAEVRMTADPGASIVTGQVRPAAKNSAASTDTGAGDQAAEGIRASVDAEKTL